MKKIKDKKLKLTKVNFKKFVPRLISRGSKIDRDWRKLSSSKKRLLIFQRNPQTTIAFGCLFLCLVIIAAGVGLGVGLKKKKNTLLNDAFPVVWQNKTNNVRFLGSEKHGLYEGFLAVNSNTWSYNQLVDSSTKNGSYLNHHSNITTINVINLTMNKTNTSIKSGEIYVGTKSNGLVDVKITEPSSANTQNQPNVITGILLNRTFFAKQHITMVSQTVVSLPTSVNKLGSLNDSANLVFVGTTSGLWCGILLTSSQHSHQSASNNTKTETWTWKMFSKLADVTKSNSNAVVPANWGPALPDTANITAFRIIHSPSVSFIGKSLTPRLTAGEYMIGTTHGAYEMVFYNIASKITLECLRFIGDTPITNNYITSLYTFPTPEMIRSNTISYGFIGTKTGLFEIVGGVRSEQGSTAWTVFAPHQYHKTAKLLTDTANISTINVVQPATEPAEPWQNIMNGEYTIGTTNYGLVDMKISENAVTEKKLAHNQTVMPIPEITETTSKIKSSNHVTAFWYNSDNSLVGIVGTTKGVYSCMQNPITLQWYFMKITL